MSNKWRHYRQTPFGGKKKRQKKKSYVYVVTHVAPIQRTWMVINCAITRGVRQNAPLTHYLIQFAYSWEKMCASNFLVY